MPQWNRCWRGSSSLYWRSSRLFLITGVTEMMGFHRKAGNPSQNLSSYTIRSVFWDWHISNFICISLITQHYINTCTVEHENFATYKFREFEGHTVRVHENSANFACMKISRISRFHEIREHFMHGKISCSTVCCPFCWNIDILPLHHRHREKMKIKHLAGDTM